MIASLLRKFVLLGGLVTLLFSLGVQPAFSDDDRGRKVKTVKVDCAKKTISKALEKHRTKALVIIVKRTCLENVVIDRNLVTLVAETPGVDGIFGQDENGAAVTVSGAQNVVIDGLRLQSAGGGDSAGVFVTGNGETTIQNALIENNDYGIRSNNGGFFLVRDSMVVNNGTYGVLLTDGANARIEESTIEGDSAAIGAFRDVSLRLRRDNVIGKASGGSSLELFHSVDFRQDGGNTVFNGPMEIGNLTNVSLRNPVVIGSINVSGSSSVEIRNSSTDSDEITGGDINVGSNSQLSFSRSGITADVGSINVHGLSSLNLNDNVSVTTSGDVNMGRSVLTMASNSSMNVGGNFGAFDRVDIGIFGDGANLNVAGDLRGNSFFNMNLGDNVSLNVGGQIFMADFTLLFGSNAVSITGDMRFGSKDGKVNLFGDNVRYTGNIEFFPDSDLNFGANATIIGVINCNGGDVSFEGMFFVSGGFLNCISFP